MNAKKCDRCGRYYDKNTEHLIGGNIPIRYAAGVQIYDNSEADRKAWDLCDDCLMEFFNWVNMKKEMI